MTMAAPIAMRIHAQVGIVFFLLRWCPPRPPGAGTGKPQAVVTLARMSRSVIVSAVRTPFGKLGGGLANYQATELGALAIRAALDRAGVENEEVEYAIMGQVLQGGAGQAPSRQATIGAGLPIDLPSDTINKVCASSIRAVEIGRASCRERV